MVQQRSSQASTRQAAIAAVSRLNVEGVAKSVDEYLTKFPVVVQAADILNIRPAYIPPLVLALVMMLLGWFENTITNSVGFFYPAWQSFKAIESPNNVDDKQWLAYWVVYAFFSFVEVFSDFLLFWVPFYYFLKVVFLLWLFLPQFMGATFMYNRVIRPFLLQHEKSIDGVMSQMAGGAASVIQDASDLANQASNVVRQRNVNRSNE